ncbi:hypothetical protein [Orenia marismortui]|uniref:Pyrroloquinoline-quinone binding quinoprotein n=1 Tax=Orenia marismortui TaxID=46469 RepID=A0A4R8GZB4_9FIRM|nr:hypothetical protein [Orenia marismortui]TDX52091.1 hypothetical protein C7959_10813 [Orenia marismortui]
MHFIFDYWKRIIITAVISLLIAFALIIVPDNWLYDMSGVSYGEEERVERFYSGTVTEDLSIIMAGSIEDNKAYILKANSKGKKEWDRSFSSAGKIKFNSVIGASDGGFVLVGEESNSKNDKGDAYILKVDFQGKKEWAKKFGEKYKDSFYSVEEVSTGGFILAGGIRVPTDDDNFNQQAYVVRVDSKGNVKWSKIFGGEYYDQFNNVKETPDGGFILVGHYEEAYLEKSGYLVKLDSEGKQEWTKKIKEKDYNIKFNSVLVKNNNEFIIVGEAKSSDNKPYAGYILSINQVGTKQWSRYYHSEEDLYTFTDIVSIDNQNALMISGYESIPVGMEAKEYRHTAFILKVENDGKELWSKTFRGSYRDGRFNSINKTRDGDFILVGWIQDYSEIDGYLLKVDSEGKEIKFKRDQK